MRTTSTPACNARKAVREPDKRTACDRLERIASSTVCWLLQGNRFAAATQLAREWLQAFEHPKYWMTVSATLFDTEREQPLGGHVDMMI